MLLARARVPVTVKVDPARYRPNDPPLLLGDPARMRDELGWTPEIPLEQTLDDLLEYWRNAEHHEGAGDGRHRVSRPRRRPRARVARTRRSSSSRAAPAAAASPARPIDGDIRDRAALERAAARLRRHLARRGARQHLAAAARGLRRHQRRRTAQRPGGRRGAPASRACSTPRRFSRSRRAAGPSRFEANDYQRTKVAADRLADQAVARRRPLIRVYPGVVYGPGTFTEGNLVGRLIADHLRHRLPGLVGPEQRWSYAYVDDVAAGHCAALERGRVGGRYVLGGENAPQRRVFEIVQQLTGRRPPRRIPFPIARADRRRRGAARARCSAARRSSRAAPSRSSATTGRSTAPTPSAISATR